MKSCSPRTHRQKAAIAATGQSGLDPQGWLAIGAVGALLALVIRALFAPKPKPV